MGRSRPTVMDAVEPYSLAFQLKILSKEHLLEKMSVDSRETTATKKNLLERKLSARDTFRLCVFWRDHLASQNMGITQSNEGLYPRTGAFSL